MPREQLKELQNEKFMKQMKHVWNDCPDYRRKMESCGVSIDDIKSLDDISKLPFLTKDDLREAYPYAMLAKPLSECVRIQSTSGTTGKRVIAYYTQHEPLSPREQQTKM